MTPQLWSFVLNWSRVGVNAALFLAATRVLTLTEIGLFATAFAPIRLIQAVQKAGLSDAVVMFGQKPHRWSALFMLSLIAGTLASTLFALIGALTTPLLLALAIIPFLNGLGAIPEGILRHRLAIKSLALRTLAAQSVAAIIALYLLSQGLGAWALAAFATISTGLTNVLSILLAKWRPNARTSWKNMSLILPKTAEIGGRILLTGSQIPLAQMAIGVFLGPAAAGAFQIATRVMDLIEALTLSPLRFIALPRISRSPDLSATLRTQMRQTALLSAWVWGGTCVATVPILTLAVGADHATVTAPILRSLAPLALITALLMPVTQALTARQNTRLVLNRAAISTGLSVSLMAPALTLSPLACAMTLTLSGGLSFLWMVHRAMPALCLNRSDLAPALAPLGAATVMVLALTLTPALPLAAQIIAGTTVYAAALCLRRPPQRNFA